MIFDRLFTIKRSRVVDRYIQLYGNIQIDRAINKRTLDDNNK